MNENQQNIIDQRWAVIPPELIRIIKEAQKENRTLIFICDAGIGRSGAIASRLRYGLNLESYMYEGGILKRFNLLIDRLNTFLLEDQTKELDAFFVDLFYGQTIVFLTLLDTKLNNTRFFDEMEKFKKRNPNYPVRCYYNTEIDFVGVAYKINQIRDSVD